jgi:hypothetical protein
MAKRAQRQPDPVERLRRFAEDAGALALAPLFAPGISQVTRPFIKALIHGWVGAADLLREAQGPRSFDALADGVARAVRHTRGELDALAAQVQAERAEASREAAEASAAGNDAKVPEGA